MQPRVGVRASPYSPGSPAPISEGGPPRPYPRLTAESAASREPPTDERHRRTRGAAWMDHDDRPVPTGDAPWPAPDVLASGRPESPDGPAFPPPAPWAGGTVLPE